ncbi:hypothetical protein [Halolamina sp.]|jgi:hypothetical protein|uniref:DUF7097 family protein n=1 Tax=Halolamina sp. TaxID=1940283 RepID=UPI003561616A
MEETPEGTPVGVDDPYEVAGVCDHLTGDGRCRYALEQASNDPEFAAERRQNGYTCLAEGEHGEPAWESCPHYRSTTDGKECVRCGLEEVRIAHDATRPLVEEHHLSYGSESNAGADGDAPSHEITVGLCRWCHTKVHRSFARIDDDASPDPEAIAAREERRGAEMEELGFDAASEHREE